MIALSYCLQAVVQFLGTDRSKGSIIVDFHCGLAEGFQVRHHHCLTLLLEPIGQFLFLSADGSAGAGRSFLEYRFENLLLLRGQSLP